MAEDSLAALSLLTPNSSLVWLKGCGWCADGQHITDKEDGDEYVGDGAWFDSF